MVVCMNKERYLKLKKDFIVLYLARNGIMTFLITLFTFSLDLSNYYQISFPATIPYIFFNNIFTLMYFCLLWIFNYLLFELFKIINDWYDENHYQTLKFMYHEHNYSISWMIYVIMAILLVIIQIVQFPTLFHIDAYLMFGFMILRSLKQIYKNRL